jgi:outer membrane immunogenic protein
MKKVVFGALALVAIGAGPALAADLPARVYTKAPQMVAAYDWSGFYIGLDGGGGWARKCWDISNNFGRAINPSIREGCHDATGGMAGAQVGYRWQSAMWVFGVEAKGDWADYRGSSTSNAFTNVINQSKVDSIGIFTGQVGYAMNNVLLYAKGGAAVAGDKYNGVITTTGVTFDAASETRVGGYLGIGIEVGVTPNVSIAGEYGHAFMGSKSVDFTATGATVTAGTFSRTDTIHQDIDIFTVRVSYRFGGPVVAKY